MAMLVYQRVPKITPPKLMGLENNCFFFFGGGVIGYRPIFSNLCHVRTLGSIAQAAELYGKAEPEPTLIKRFRLVWLSDRNWLVS